MLIRRSSKRPAWWCLGCLAIAVIVPAYSCRFAKPSSNQPHRSWVGLRWPHRLSECWDWHDFRWCCEILKFNLIRSSGLENLKSIDNLLAGHDRTAVQWYDSFTLAGVTKHCHRLAAHWYLWRDWTHASISTHRLNAIGGWRTEFRATFSAHISIHYLLWAWCGLCVLLQSTIHRSTATTGFRFGRLIWSQLTARFRCFGPNAVACNVACVLYTRRVIDFDFELVWSRNVWCVQMDAVNVIATRYILE